MNILEKYGWNSYTFSSSYQQTLSAQTNLGRVTSIQGNHFIIITMNGFKTAELLGKIAFTYEKWEQPKVGDWVTFLDYGESAYIDGVLPRQNQLHRKSPGRETSLQVMVANLDQAVVVQGLDQDFNLNRIERYLVQIIACQVEPVILLNKCDLTENIAGYLDQVRKLQRSLPVFVCSVKTGYGMDEVRHRLFQPGRTHALIGSSGVGKSSIINALTTGELRTSAISSATGKGRHTTTTRDLFLIDNGAILIDTPGMREFGLSLDGDADFDAQFPAIAAFAGECRFSDCSHLHEAGCNVIRAYEEGELEPVVYENYVKLMREQKRFQTSIEEKNKEGKRFGKMAREAQAYRKKYKF